MMRDLTVEQHSTWNGLALNCLYTDYPVLPPVIHQEIHRKKGTTCLTLPLASKWNLLFYIFPLMSACHNLRSCSPLKTVLNQLQDTYQAYCNTYKTHPMATHHGGTGHSLDREATLNGKDTDANILHNYHHEDMDDFEKVEMENHTNQATLTRE